MQISESNVFFLGVHDVPAVKNIFFLYYDIYMQEHVHIFIGYARCTFILSQNALQILNYFFEILNFN